LQLVIAALLQYRITLHLLQCVLPNATKGMRACCLC